MEKQLKIFNFDDCDWVCHYSKEEAVDFYKEATGFDDLDMEEMEVKEVSLSNTMLVSFDSLPEEERCITELGMEYFDGELCVRRSFSWVIKHEGITEPCIIASKEM